MPSIAQAWTSPPTSSAQYRPASLLNVQTNFFESLTAIFSSGDKVAPSRSCKARDLVTNLIEDERCFATDAGALAFGQVCASDVVYDDCFESKPFVGKTVRFSG